MSDLVGPPEDLFSRVFAHTICHLWGNSYSLIGLLCISLYFAYWLLQFVHVCMCVCMCVCVCVCSGSKGMTARHLVEENPTELSK